MNDIAKNVEQEVAELKTIAKKYNVENNHLFQTLDAICSLSRRGQVVDRKLMDVECEIRKSIIQSSILGQYKSPYKLSEQNSVQKGAVVTSEFDYERALPPVCLERKMERDVSNKQWFKFLLVFRSGMSAMDSVLKLIVSLYAKQPKITITTLVYYFELHSLLQLFFNNHWIEINHLTSIDGFYKALQCAESNVFIFESMDVYLKSKKIDILELNNAIRRRNSKKPLIIIADTTLCNSFFNIDTLLDGVESHVLLIGVRSALKLDQQGLELSNLGVVKVYSNVQSLPFEKIKKLLCDSRTLTGTTITSAEEYMLLSDLFSEQSTIRYTRQILYNAKKLCDKVSGKHTCHIKSVRYQQDAPFFILELEDQKKYDDFISELLSFAKSKGVSINIGTSFGFRHLRLEIIHHKTGCYIRISPGVYWGNDCECLIDFLNNY